MRFLSTVLIVFSVMLAASQSHGASLLDPQTLENVVLLEQPHGDSYRALGTGVLVRVGPPDAPTIVVTAKHVLERAEVAISIPADPDLVEFMSAAGLSRAEINGQDWELVGERLRSLHLCSEGELWVAHPDTSIDLAAFPLAVGSEHDIEGRVLQVANVRVITRSFSVDLEDIDLGAVAYFLGFPRGFGSADPILPIVRFGNVAWKDPLGDEFWLDAVSMGGNSGGPAYLASATLGGQSASLQLATEPARFIGVVFGHWSERGLLLMPGESAGGMMGVEREIENLGLVRVIPVERVFEVAELAREGFDGTRPN